MNHKSLSVFLYSWIIAVFGVYLIQYKPMIGSIIEKFLP